MALSLVETERNVMHGPELSDVIATLRENLEDAQQQGAGHKLRFSIDVVEVELQVAVTKGLETEGKVKFWVVDAKGSGTLSDVRTQKIKLTMKVVDPTKNNTTGPLISGEDTIIRKNKPVPQGG